MTLRHILLPLCALGALAATAQNKPLSTTVDVDRTIRPAEREAVRPDGFGPALQLPPATAPHAERAAYDSLADITRNISLLDPAQAPLAAEPTPWRGYAALGYFPGADIGATAGYRAVSRTGLHIDAFAQALHRQYDTQAHYRYTTVTLGTRGDWTPKAHSGRLDYDVHYNYLDANCHWVYVAEKASDVHAAATWRQTLGRYSYKISAAFDLDAPSEGQYNQQVWQLEGSMRRDFSDRSALAVDLGFDYLYNRLKEPSLLPGHSIGFVSLAPGYEYRNGAMYFRAGVRLDAGCGNYERNVLHFAPDVRLQCHPWHSVGLWLAATGGDGLATAAMQRAYSPFARPNYGYGDRHHVKLRAEGGLSLGPWRGFAAEVSVAHASVNDWLMVSEYGSSLEGTDVAGWRLHLGASYEWQQLTAKLSADYVPSSKAHPWYEYRDYAGTVLHASVKWHVNSSLDVEGSWQGRYNRHAAAGDWCGGTWQPVVMGNVNRLDLGALWHFSSRLGAFARLENLLCCKYQVLDGIYAPRLHGALGIEYKF